MKTEIAHAPMPTSSEKVAGPQWQAASKKRSSHEEDVFNTILWRLNARQAVGQTMVVGITACQSKSGTTTIVAKLALLAGLQQVGRVLLIDANANSPALKEVFDLAPHSSLVDVLSGETAPRECEPEQVAENVFVLSYGEVRSEEGVRINRQLASEMMEQFRLDYDLIFVDLPAAKELRSALPIAKSLDGVLLVTCSEAVKQPEAHRIAQQLQQDGIELWGAVLNRHREYVPRWLRKWL